MNRAATQHKRAAYPAYKPSGIEWLGEIPEHWELRRLKYIASVQFSNVDKNTFEGEEPVRLCNYIDVYKNELIKDDFEFMQATATRAEIRKFTLRQGDVVITKDSESWTDIAVPAYVADQLQGVICGYHLAQIRAKFQILDGKYLFRAFASKAINYQFQVASTGITRYGLGNYWLENGLLVLPPLPEQRAIAAFLDRETARIDGLIEKKRRQIELLREKRSALISHAVTKGLDPNAKMKDSGIEWLGEIPEHWELRRLKYIASVQFSNVDKNTFEGEEPVRLCNYIDVYKNELIKDDFEFMQATATRAEIRKFTLRQGDVVITKDSESWTDIAVPAYVADQLQGVICGYHLAQIRAKFQILDGKYLFRAFASKAINYQFQVASTGITRYGLGNYWLENGLLVLPPLPEQRAIAAFLDRETARIDSLIEKVEKSIELLREYRTALISAAVTGRIDVRKEAV